nr:hypothetical protein [Chloroflexia bacterium]
YVAALEIVRDTYAAPADPAVPLVCFDEAGKELQAHARDPPPPPRRRGPSPPPMPGPA